jgi:GNAT superfamily N-acetyltransferase
VKHFLPEEDMPITYRKATHADNFTAFVIFRASLDDFSRRMGITAITGGHDPDKMKQLWERRRRLWEHLTDTCDQYWIAEKEDGEAVGYARSIVRGDHRELTEFFVEPGSQSAGVGKGLIQRAFPDDTPHRSVIATPDLRAISRYLKAGVYPFVTELYFERTPEPVVVDTDLAIESPSDLPAAIQTLGDIDQVILGYRRDVDHGFITQDRNLFLYRRSGRVVGYGYIEKDYYGPFALLDKADFPAVLAHAESQAHALGAGSVGFEVPTINTVAADYLISRGYRLEGFLGSIMSNMPFGKFENYLLFSPPYFL